MNSDGTNKKNDLVTPEKFYQVFISSTKDDLSNTRLAVMDILRGSKFFPLGMEDFDAQGRTVWEVITDKINKADFFVLILGDNYGSYDKTTRKSYTQLEYEYAVEHEKEILAFVKEDLQNDTKEYDKTKAKKLANFKRQVKDAKKVVKIWNSSEQDKLPGFVYRALTKSLENMERAGNTPAGLISGRFLNYLHFPRETTMNFYNIHLKIIGTKEDCEKGTAIATYLGAAQVDSPNRPIVYKDYVQNGMPIIEHQFSPQEEVLNDEAFGRTSLTLSYQLVSPYDADKLRFTGKIVVYKQLRQIKGGLGLHIPYFAENVTIFLDISSVPFIRQYKPHAWVYRADRDGKERPFDETKTSFDEATMTYTIGAWNLPANSNIMFNWDNREEVSK